MKLAVYTLSGSIGGEVEILDSLLERKVGKQAVRDAVVAYLAAQRSGTASTLSKGEVAGSNKKPWRQKGTGRARAGYRQSPIWRGGGVAFGPHPRSYKLGINKKVARLALRRALSERFGEGKVVIVEAVQLDQPKTKSFLTLMKALKIERPALFVVEKADRSVALASRNLEGVEVVNAGDLNAYQVLRYPRVVFSRSAIDIVQRRVGAGEVKQ